MPSLFIESRECFVRWTELGDAGPVVVWLPGIGFSALGCFLGAVAHPAFPKARSILIDPLGAGQSDPVAELSIIEHADIVADVLDRLGHVGCFVVGYSMGGTIAAELALRRPDLVSCLIMAEGALVTGGGPGARHIASCSASEFRATRLPELLAQHRAGAMRGDGVDDFILAHWSRVDPAAFQGMAKAIISLRPELESEILALDLPRHYIFGARHLEDPVTRAAKNLPDPDRMQAAGILVHGQEGVGHELMLSDPAGFVALVAPLVTA
jgi:pimeloyl-ACP methyl ester carboxylesterase